MKQKRGFHNFIIILLSILIMLIILIIFIIISIIYIIFPSLWFIFFFLHQKWWKLIQVMILFLINLHCTFIITGSHHCFLPSSMILWDGILNNTRKRIRLIWTENFFFLFFTFHFLSLFSLLLYFHSKKQKNRFIGFVVINFSALKIFYYIIL